MAKEIKSFKVHPDYEEAEINFRRKVGWEFISTQEIYNKDTHMEGGIFTDTVTSVTETTHFVKLTFQRETENVNPELISLERQIDNMRPPEEPHTWGTMALIVGFMLYVLPGIFMMSSNKKKKQEYERVYSEYQNEFRRLLARVDELQMVKS
ncbi:MAG: hypothetical protein HFI81_08325 [Eubacterium sp.]|jgi:hypothetical protein|nr:hypothetical protein [Eubacterium sp.]